MNNNVEKIFQVVTRENEKVFFTARELFEIVSKNSKSDYNWVASATELYNVCQMEGFDKKYAKSIMLLILNCYATLELKITDEANYEETAQETVNNIYNRFSFDDKEASFIKERYLRNVILAVTMYNGDEERIKLNYCHSFYELEENWKNEMYFYYCEESDLDFKIVRRSLRLKYEDFMKEAYLDENVKKEINEIQKIREIEFEKIVKRMAFKA